MVARGNKLAPPPLVSASATPKAYSAGDAYPLAFAYDPYYWYGDPNAFYGASGYPFFFGFYGGCCGGYYYYPGRYYAGHPYGYYYGAGYHGGPRSGGGHDARHDWVTSRCRT